MGGIGRDWARRRRATQRAARLRRGIGPYISGSLNAACRKREITGSETMDPKSTAVVLIEYQNDFTTEGGTLHQGRDRQKGARTRRDHRLCADQLHRRLP